ncbi:MAG: hypothetical protein K940chlam3_00079 [Chlamydiae bacterium]|nr:hypothetical protein [Chlamydiota bacterium]
MVAENKIKTVLDELKEHGVAHVRVLGSLITAKACLDSSKLWLTTAIYEGNNYIPDSIRECLKAPSPVPHSKIATFVSVDEKKFQLVLNYVGIMHDIDYQRFKDLVEQFSWDAEEWRYYLDDFDKRELIHVRRN